METSIAFTLQFKSTQSLFYCHFSILFFVYFSFNSILSRHSFPFSDSLIFNSLIQRSSSLIYQLKTIIFQITFLKNYALLFFSLNSNSLSWNLIKFINNTKFINSNFFKIVHGDSRCQRTIRASRHCFKNFLNPKSDKNIYRDPELFWRNLIYDIFLCVVCIQFRQDKSHIFFVWVLK